MCATHPLRLFVVADCCCCHRRRRRWSVGARVVGCALRILREEPKTLERERGAPASLGDAHGSARRLWTDGNSCCRAAAANHGVALQECRHRSALAAAAGTDQGSRRAKGLQGGSPRQVSPSESSTCFIYPSAAKRRVAVRNASLRRLRGRGDVIPQG